MRMMVQVLPPGVEHGNQPERGAEMLGVGGEAQRLGCRLEQDAVDDGLVLEGDLGDRRRHGEDNVEVGHGSSSVRRSASHSARASPWHFAVPVAQELQAMRTCLAVVALLDMTARRRRAAGSIAAMTRRWHWLRWPAWA